MPLSLGKQLPARKVVLAYMPQSRALIIVALNRHVLGMADSSANPEMDEGLLC